MQICGHASWIGLCLKSVDVDGMVRAVGSGSSVSNINSSTNKSSGSNRKYTLEDHSLVIGCLKICKQHA